MLSPLFVLEGCQCNGDFDTKQLMTRGNKNGSLLLQDSPQTIHSVQELSSGWVWTTTDGDAASDFQISIEQVSDNEIVIINFHNLDGERITATIDGEDISFGGPLMDGSLEVRGGHGTITNGWLTINLEYELYDGTDTERFAAKLEKGHTL